MAFFADKASKPSTRSSVRDKAFEGAYISVDSLLKLRHIAKDVTLQTNKKSSAIMDGDSRTSFRGRGMEFAEVRPYHAGDDIRNIDWRVTARAQKPYTKLFQEERERPIFLVVDQRSPMFFGSVAQFKSVYAAKLAATISWAALANNDRIGALIFSDTSQTDSRARRGKHAVLALLHQLHTFNGALNSPFMPEQHNTLEEMLTDIRRAAKPGSAVYIISDFHDFNEGCKEPLSVLSRHTDVSLFHVHDPLEKILPLQQNLTIASGDGDGQIDLSGQSSRFNEAFSQSFERNQEAIRHACQVAGVTFASLSIDIPLEQMLSDVFVNRTQRRRGGR
ncbi:MAG: DUF58 domain-containing protein [Alteromonadaceae bacterium]|nr:MAG: DUF58 domain-containing protein [Alteromonadaceae bacterium]